MSLSIDSCTTQTLIIKGFSGLDAHVRLFQYSVSEERGSINGFVGEASIKQPWGMEEYVEQEGR